MYDKLELGDILKSLSLFFSFFIVNPLRKNVKSYMEGVILQRMLHASFAALSFWYI